MNLNRSVEDDDDENAQNRITSHSPRLINAQHPACVCTLLYHQLTPITKRLQENTPNPEWNHQSRNYMKDHCRVLEAPPQERCKPFAPDPRRIREVRRQLEALRPAVSCARAKLTDLKWTSMP